MVGWWLIPTQPKDQEAPAEADASLDILSPLFPKLGVTVQITQIFNSVYAGWVQCLLEGKDTSKKPLSPASKSHGPPPPTSHSDSAQYIGLFAGATHWDQAILSPTAIHVSPLISLDAAGERLKTEKAETLFWTLASLWPIYANNPKDV